MRILVGAAVVALSLGASSIQATNTEAVIESVVPTLPAGVSIDVVGADSFLRVRAAGHVVEVPGYEGEPYLRIDGDGRTRVNEASASAILNRDRYGSTAATDATSETPRWRTTGSNGTLLWHDHRIHWMSRSTPPTIDEAGTVLEFDVPVVVDSTTHVVSGVLYLRDEASPAWWGIAVLAAAAMYVASRRRRRATAVTAACVAALGVAVGGEVTPARFDGEVEGEMGTGVQRGELEILVEDLHIGRERDVGGGDLLGALDVETQHDGLVRVGYDDEVLEVEDELGDVLGHPLDGGELVVDAVELDGGDGGTRDRGQERPAQRVADGVAEAGLQRTDCETLLGGMVFAEGLDGRTLDDKHGDLLGKGSYFE